MLFVFFPISNILGAVHVRIDSIALGFVIHPVTLINIAIGVSFIVKPVAIVLRAVGPDLFSHAFPLIGLGVPLAQVDSPVLKAVGCPIDKLLTLLLLVYGCV